MKKTQKILSIFGILTLFFVTSCDEVSQPFEKNNNGETQINKDAPRVLLEEFTGYKCINCPRAARMLHGLMENTYKDNVILVAFHAGNFAKPDKKKSGHFKYDFRTKVGNELNDFFSITSNPSAVINRTPYESGLVINWGNWAAAIQNYFDKYKTSPVNIKLNSTFDKTEGKLTAEVDLEYLQDAGNANYLSVWVTEDGIKYWQLDREATPKEVENYEHNHVFRYSFNGTWGDLISATDVIAGTKINKKYDYVLPSDCDWNTDNLNIVAFVYDANAGKKILQAIQVKPE